MPTETDNSGAFTGRARRRKTSKMVRFADIASRTLITMGGLGTILAVFVVCVFLVYVAAPLFRPAWAEGPLALLSSANTLSQASGAQAPPPDRPIFTALNDYRLLGIEVFADGRTLVFDPRDGGILATHRPSEEIHPTAFSFSRGDGSMAMGFTDGSIQLGRLRFLTDFLADGDVPEGLRNLEVGSSEAHTDSVVERTPSGFRAHRLAVELEPPVPPESDSPIRLLDLTTHEGRSIYVALSEDGALRVRRARRQENWMTGEVSFVVSGGALPYKPPQDEPPAFLKVSALGDTVFVAWQDGLMQRFDTRNLNQPRLAEEIDVVADEGASLTAAAFLIGRTTLVTGDSKGRIRAWFRVKPDEVARSADGLPMYRTERLSDYGGPLSLVARLPIPRHAQMPPELEGEPPEQYRLDPTSDASPLAMGHAMEAGRATVTALAESNRSRMLLAGYSDGSVRLFHVTTNRLLAELPGTAGEPIRTLAVAPREDGVLAATDSGMLLWDIRPQHPAISPAAIFRPVWYEGYSRPALVWQSSGGTDHFEPKYSLMPLVFGTMKATVYAMLFALPLALLAAVYTSEFMRPAVKAWVKPLIEVMASLPSVVLGFLAALIFAPIIEKAVPSTLMLFFTVPLALLLGAFLWQLVPHDILLRLEHIGVSSGAGAKRKRARGRAAAGRALCLAGGLRLLCVWAMFFAGVAAAIALGPAMESILFGEDLAAWLDGQIEPATGGWAMLLAPFSAIAVAAAFVGWINPALRPLVRGWTRRRTALLSLAKFCVGAAVAAALAGIIGWVFNVVGLDPRGDRVFPPHVFGTYGQRNALIVGFAMAFAVIPIIYTIAEDALSSVPDHLRAASLGAGATRWQTALRIIIPTAMSGLFSATMIGLGRAVGETMIVLMAAGNTPVLEWNIFSGFRTLSANIAVELPEAALGGTLYRTLFLAALTLFAMTFAINTVAELVRLRFRRRASHL